MFKIGEMFISDDMAYQYIGLHNAICEYAPKLIAAMREKKNTAFTTELDSRTLNYWTQCGLLDKDSDKKQPKWHKFSFVDIVFINIVKKLRGFGMNMEQAKQVKRDLYNLVVITDTANEICFDTQFSRLETAILFAMTLKHHGNTYLVVQADGTTTTMTDADIELNRENNAIPNECIFLKLNALLFDTDILSRIQARIVHETIDPSWRNGEKQVLEALRQAGTTEVVVKKNSKTGEIVQFETAQEVADISGMPDFGSVQVSRQDGKTVRIIRRTSTKVKQQ